MSNFPIDDLASKMSINEFNFHSILDGLVEWDKTETDTVTIRLASGTDPYYQDYVIPSKNSVLSASTMSATIQKTAVISTEMYGYIPIPLSVGDVVKFTIRFPDNGATGWELYSKSLTLEEGDVLLQDMPIVDGETYPSEVTVNHTFAVPSTGVYLKPKNDSPKAVDISLEGRVVVEKYPTIHKNSVGVYPSTNYNNWPVDTDPKWTDTISGTDEGIGIDELQDYTAQMVFDHSSVDTKTINYLNYNGPDLDQGLAVILPVRSNGAVPEDGFTMQFNLRIWPTSSYTNSTTSDHVVNKSQVYFYSVDNAEDISDLGVVPFARFSMARLTNFYIWAENIAIPDKPVNYHIEVIYSETLGEWIINKYNQLDDHVFVGQVGFVDPLDYNGDSGSTSTGYETMALPMFTDPFDSNVVPVRYSDPDFFKRTI
jgi:hypothetical protein